MMNKFILELHISHLDKALTASINGENVKLLFTCTLLLTPEKIKTHQTLLE